MRIAGYDINAASKKLVHLKNLSSVKRNHWRITKKWQIAQFHFENNSIYKRKVGNYFPDSWNDLPVMHKYDYQNKIERLLSNGFNKKNIYLANTSGSSGHPFHFAKDKKTHALTWAFIVSRYKDLGIDHNDLEARFYGIPLEPKAYYLEKLKDTFLKRKRFSVFDLSPQRFIKFIKEFNNNNYKYIYGYTNAIVLFARYIIETDLKFKQICNSLKLIILTSEVCTQEDRAILKNAFGVPVISEYGASEFGYIGFEKAPGKWEVVNDLVYLENDIEGNILITDLHNKAFPFIKYKIGDVGDVYTDSEGTQHIENLKGRTSDNIILPSGKISPGLTFYYISRSILEKTNFLQEFIIKQIELDYFIFDIVSKRAIDDDISLEIKDKMDKYLEPGLRFDLNRVNFIKRPNSGKIKHFYSMLN